MTLSYPSWPDSDQIELERARIAAAAQAPLTRSSYSSDLRVYARWAAASGNEAFPAPTDSVIGYLTALLSSGRRVSTACRHACAILDRHRSAGLPLPDKDAIRTYLRQARRLRAEQPIQKRALTIAELRRMCLTEPPGARGTRNRAILALGFASALRRANIVALDLEDVEFTDKGIVLRIGREKQNQDGRHARTVGLTRGRWSETCPVEALGDWLRIRGTAEPGPLFVYCRGRVEMRRLAPCRVGSIVQRAARRIGLEPARYAGHSLRAGCITAAIEAGIGEIALSRHTGHRSLASLQRYYRSADVFRLSLSSIGL